MKLNITRYKFRDGTFAYMADTSLPNKPVMVTEDFMVDIPDEPKQKQNEQGEKCHECKQFLGTNTMCSECARFREKNDYASGGVSV